MHVGAICTPPPQTRVYSVHYGTLHASILIIWAIEGAENQNFYHRRLCTLATVDLTSLPALFAVEAGLSLLLEQHGFLHVRYNRILKTCIVREAFQQPS